MKPKRPHRPFLANPFWRNGVVAYMLIGFGFLISSPGFPTPIIGYFLMAAGVVIFLIAMAH